MAIASTDGTSHATRTTGTFPDNTGDWTLLFAFRYISLFAGSGATVSLFATTDDFANPYLYIGTTNNVNDFAFFVDVLSDGGASEQHSASFSTSLGTWYWATITYAHTSHTLSLYVNAALVGSVTVNLSAVTWSILDMLNDSTGESGWTAVAYCRAWSSVLTPTQMSAEAASKTAVLASGLLWDYRLPNPSYLSDHAGIQPDLTANGSPGWIAGPLDTVLTTIPIGAPFITDFVWGSTAVLSTSGTYLGIVPQAASDFGEMLPNGTLAIFDGNDSNKTVLYGKGVTEIARVASPSAFTSHANISSDRNHTFYVATCNGSAAAKLGTVSDTGTIGNTTWTLPNTSKSLSGMAPNAAGTILYYTSQTTGGGGTGSVLYAYDLVNSVALTDLVAALASHEATKDVIVLADGTILVGYHGDLVTDHEYVKRYDASGSLLNTYDFGARSTPVNLNRIGRGADDPHSFWVWLEGAQPVTFKNVAVADGSILSSFTITEAGTAGDPDLGQISNSCPILIAVGADVGYRYIMKVAPETRVFQVASERPVNRIMRVNKREP